MGQLQIVIITSSREVSGWVRWTINKVLLAYSLVLAEMAASSSGDDSSEDLLPKYGWRVHLDNTFSHKPQPCYIPRWSQIPRLIGLGWRYYPILWSCLCFFFVNRSHRRLLPANWQNVVTFSWVIARSISGLWSMLQGKGRTVECRLLTRLPQIRAVKYTVSLHEKFMLRALYFLPYHWQKCFWKRLDKLLKCLIKWNFHHVRLC